MNDKVGPLFHRPLLNQTGFFDGNTLFERASPAPPTERQIPVVEFDGPEPKGPVFESRCGGEDGASSGSTQLLHADDSQSRIGNGPSFCRSKHDQDIRLSEEDTLLTVTLPFTPLEESSPT